MENELAGIVGAGAKLLGKAEQAGENIKTAAVSRMEVVKGRMDDIRGQVNGNPDLADEYQALTEEMGRLAMVTGQ